LRALQCLEPCNGNNPQPLFLTRGVRFESPTILKERHLRFTAVQGATRITAIYFGGAEELPKVQANGGKGDIVFEPKWNEFNGRRNLQLMVRRIL
jgi:single-stranded-DNA-specific exonuclease